MGVCDFARRSSNPFIPRTTYNYPFSLLVSRTAEDREGPRRTRTCAQRPMVKDAKTVRARSGKAPPKPRGQSKRKTPEVPASPKEPKAQKSYRTNNVGVEYMLFRVLTVASLCVGAVFCPVSAPAIPMDCADAEISRILVAAGIAGGVARLAWKRCGFRGTDGQQVHHAPDSRVHRYEREHGFSKPDQAEIDADSVAQETQDVLRGAMPGGNGHQTRVQKWSMFERYVLMRHSKSLYAKFLFECEKVDTAAARLAFVAPPPHLVTCYAVYLRYGDTAQNSTGTRDKHGNSIKTYVSAITGTCYEFGVSDPPHAKNKQLRDNMNEWVDADEVASAAAFDMATDLPKLYASCWSMAASQQRRLKAWTMFLYAISIMGRASDVTTFCADVKTGIRLPEAAHEWDADGLPSYIEVAHLNWKWRRKANVGKKYWLKLHRNYLDSRFCVVFHLLMYLHYFEIERGPIFQNGKGDAMSPSCWETMTNHIFKGAGLYTPCHTDEDNVHHEKSGCTNHSIRRTAAQWAGRCGAKEVDVRNAGRWKTMEELAKYMAQGHVDKATAQRKANGEDPIRKIWWFQPVTEGGICGKDQM